MASSTFLLLVSWVTIAYSTVNVSIPTYVLNTSLPANEYLYKFCQEQRENALRAFPIMIDMLPKAMQPAAERVAMEYWNSGAVKEPYRSEIEYFANCSGLTMEQIMTVNIIYDLTAFCTSIVCVTTNGEVLHTRNQDFPTVLRNDTVNLIYVDADNNTLYEGTTFAGYVGIPTGIKYNGFSITIDARYDIYGLQNWLDIKSNDYFPAGWLVRETLRKDSHFEQAIERLSNTKIQAPIYYIIAGTDQTMNGAVITRNQTEVNGPNKSHDVWYLNNSNYEWYLVETNYDHWKSADDSRRKHAVNMLNSVGQENISCNNYLKYYQPHLF